ncbi:MAG: DUF2244 domain-containing protein [Burkholderiales bacterium]|nr:DUF2244 domain-containing protein [Burkholderiales bacterium]
MLSAFTALRVDAENPASETRASAGFPLGFKRPAPCLGGEARANLRRLFRRAAALVTRAGPNGTGAGCGEGTTSMDDAQIDTPGQNDWLLVSRRNRSLSTTGRYLFLGSIAMVSFGIAFVWSLNGVWYVLPFTCVEMVVLFVAFKVFERHANDFESIRLTGDRILVERRTSGRVSRHEFDRYWAQLVVTRSGPGNGVELALRSHGREVPFGEFLTDEQRADLANELKRRLKGF